MQSDPPVSSIPDAAASDNANSASVRAVCALLYALCVPCCTRCVCLAVRAVCAGLHAWEPWCVPGRLEQHLKAALKRVLVKRAAACRCTSRYRSEGNTQGELHQHCSRRDSKPGAPSIVGFTCAPSLAGMPHSSRPHIRRGDREVGAPEDSCARPASTRARLCASTWARQGMHQHGTMSPAAGSGASGGARGPPAGSSGAASGRYS
jgi:hypothetical protein